MDLVGLQALKQDLQKFTQSLLNSAAPTESQAARKQAMDELRFITKNLIEKDIPEVKAINAKYEPLMEGLESTGKMAETVQKSVKPTAFQSLKSRLPKIGSQPPADTGKVALELERRLPRYTQEIADQSAVASKAQGQMTRLRPPQTPPQQPTSWTGAVRPRGPRPGSGLIGGPQTQPLSQLMGPPNPIPQVGPRRLPQTFFEGEGFSVRPTEFGGSPTPQIPVSGQKMLPAPPNLYGEGFKTLTPEEQLMRRGPEIMSSLPEGPTPVFSRLQVPGEYSPVRPNVEAMPVRGTFPLDTNVGMEIPGPTPYQKGINTSILNRLLDRAKIWPKKGYGE
jgi:hypothetical protein